MATATNGILMSVANIGFEIRGEVLLQCATGFTLVNRAPMIHKLSLVIITHNAASTLAACLQSAQHLAEEIIIVDHHSHDDTVSIAKRFGAVIHSHDWLGFGPQKQLAVCLARHHWVLCIDADEQLSPTLAENIAATLNEPQYSVYRMARRNRFLGRYLHHGEAYPDWCTRLFDRRHAHWSEHAVHEHIMTACPVGTLEGDLLHDSAQSLNHYLMKQNYYTNVQAEQLFRNRTKASIWRLLSSPSVRFMRYYIFKQGFRDGLAGFTHIIIGCFFAFIKYAKLREHWQKQQR